MKPKDILNLKNLYQNGKNITKYAQSLRNTNINTQEVIECAYDLQAGSYINLVKENEENFHNICKQYASYIEPYLFKGITLLDIGTGELTTLTILTNLLNPNDLNLLAFDTSWSRLHLGMDYYRENIKAPKVNLDVFASNMDQIPLPSKSVDIAISSHALEPNGGNIEAILQEIYRVSNLCIFFEPSFEINCAEGQRRMKDLGYVTNLKKAINDTNGTLINFNAIENPLNPLNPTACYIVKTPNDSIKTYRGKINLTAPGSDYILQNKYGFMLSDEIGISYPILKDIPILKESNAILSTAI